MRVDERTLMGKAIGPVKRTMIYTRCSTIGCLVVRDPDVHSDCLSEDCPECTEWRIFQSYFSGISKHLKVE